MINIIDKQECCGCTACASICEHDAIIMQADALGFQYPELNKELCVDCGLCDKVCAFQNGYDISLNKKAPDVFAVRHKNMQEIETSRSGAMFIALSDDILNQGGVIYGVGYSNHFRVTHKKAETKEQCTEFKGSKYVQSDLGKVFNKVRDDLKGGLKVLFSGTPCQTSGLKKFINKRYWNQLLLVDIVCHGVPAPRIWQDYVRYIEKKYNSKIRKISFRDKSLGWASHYESFVLDTGKKVIKDTYRRLFYKHIMLRPSCGVCKYTNTKRPSDITIADYWGWQKLDKDFNKDDKGCSLVIVNTNKGKEVWESIQNQLNYIKSDLSKCMQPNLKKPTSLSPWTNQFAKDYTRWGFKLTNFIYNSKLFIIYKVFLKLKQ